MRRTAKELALRFWRHLLSPITVRSLIAVAIIVWFAWTLMDRARHRENREAEIRQILAHAETTQDKLGEIRQSWSNFEEERKAFVENQQRMLENLQEVTEILKQERQIRETLLIAPKPKRKRTPRKPVVRPCFRIEEREVDFGSAKVTRQVLVAIPCK